MKQFSILQDNYSQPIYSVPFSTDNYTARLAAGVDTTLAVPTGARVAVISGNDWYYVDDAAITLPTAGAGFSAAAGHQSKEVLSCEGVTTLHFIARSDTDITVSFYG